MSSYFATINWSRSPDEPFCDNKYSRRHDWDFDGGQKVSASSSPHIVPLPFSDEHSVDPEEAFVASLSSCHMLFFLSFAARAGFCVDGYIDKAEGVMGNDGAGRQAMIEIMLRPEIMFSGDKQPSDEEVESLHHRSHNACFIANSVKTKVTVKT